MSGTKRRLTSCSMDDEESSNDGCCRGISSSSSAEVPVSGILSANDSVVGRFRKGRNCRILALLGNAKLCAKEVNHAHIVTKIHRHVALGLMESLCIVLSMFGLTKPLQTASTASVWKRRVVHVINT